MSCVAFEGRRVKGTRMPGGRLNWNWGQRIDVAMVVVSVIESH